MKQNLYVIRNLRELRLRKGYTQERLAEKCGLSVNYVRRMEIGWSNPTLRVVSRLTAALGCTLDDLCNPD